MWAACTQVNRVEFTIKIWRELKNYNSATNLRALSNKMSQIALKMNQIAPMMSSPIAIHWRQVKTAIAILHTLP